MKLLEFAKIIGKLKQTKRAGWVNLKIPNSESVAEHSFSVALLTMVLAKQAGLNVEKTIKMALIHDLGEAIIGDIVWMKAGGKIIKNKLAEKKRKEVKAIKKIFSLIDGDEYIQLFNEYEENKTKEAQFVKQLDRLEFALQQIYYENHHKMKLPDSLLAWPKSNVVHKTLKRILNEIEKLRKKK